MHGFRLIVGCTPRFRLVHAPFHLSLFVPFKAPINLLVERDYALAATTLEGAGTFAKEHAQPAVHVLRVSCVQVERAQHAYFLAQGLLEEGDRLFQLDFVAGAEVLHPFLRVIMLAHEDDITRFMAARFLDHGAHNGALDDAKGGTPGVLV
jgi:hypothetical protein